MKLHYRGLSYEYNPSQEAQQPFQPLPQSGKVYNLMYRGVTYRVEGNAKLPQFPASLAAYKLIYRGLSYLINGTAQGKVTIASQGASNLKA